MKFRKGVDVEVMKDGFWFPANIVSVFCSGYVVKYSLLLDRVGKPVVEERDVIRPVPPRDVSKKWVAGEVAEVFDGCCWKEGKIYKVLKNNIYVIKLFKSVMLKQFRESDLRIRKIWCDGKWSEISEVAQNKLTHTSIQPALNDLHPRRKGVKQRKTSPYAKGCDRLLTRRRSSDIGTKTHRATAGRLNKFSRPLESANDSDKCSVASCSSNEFAVYLGENSISSFDRVSDSSDAESSVRNSTSYTICGLQADVHRLELHAYKSTVMALYASGPLSWEQESLLTNLRLSLHISDDEHLLHLKRLMSARVL